MVQIIEGLTGIRLLRAICPIDPVRFTKTTERADDDAERWRYRHQLKSANAILRRELDCREYLAGLDARRTSMDFSGKYGGSVCLGSDGLQIDDDLSIYLLWKVVAEPREERVEYAKDTANRMSRS